MPIRHFSPLATFKSVRGLQFSSLQLMMDFTSHLSFNRMPFPPPVGPTPYFTPTHSLYHSQPKGWSDALPDSISGMNIQDYFI